MTKALCEKQDGTYEWVEMGEIECGRDFCDRCGDCLLCYEDNDYCLHSWILYKDNELNPLTKQAA